MSGVDDLDLLQLQHALSQDLTMARAASHLLALHEGSEPLIDAVGACLARIESVTGPALEEVHSAMSEQRRENLNALERAIFDGEVKL